MAVYAIAATVGTPDSAAIVPITTNNLVPPISGAVSSANATSVITSNTLKLASSSFSSSTALQTSCSTLVTSGGTIVTDNATSLADHDSACSSLLSGVGSNSGTLSYSTSTHLFTGAATTATLTSAQMVVVVSALNTEATAMLATSAIASTTQVLHSATNTLAGTNLTAVANTSADASLASGSASATAVATSAIVAGTGGNNLLTQFDTSVITTAATLNGALAETLNFVKNAGILT